MPAKSKVNTQRIQACHPQTLKIKLQRKQRNRKSLIYARLQFIVFLQLIILSIMHFFLLF